MMSSLCDPDRSLNSGFSSFRSTAAEGRLSRLAKRERPARHPNTQSIVCHTAVLWSYGFRPVWLPRHEAMNNDPPDPQ